MSQDLWAAFSSEPVVNVPSKTPSKALPASSNSDIFFDQETALTEGDDFGDFEEGEDDDFGDFEAANDPLASPAVSQVMPQVKQPGVASIPSVHSQDLSSLIDFDDPVFENPKQNYVPPEQMPPSNSIQQIPITPQIPSHIRSTSRSFATVQGSSNSSELSSPIKTTPKPTPSPMPKDSFDAFEQQYNTVQKSSFDSLRQVVPSLSDNSSQQGSALPPENVPPPALILSLFPRIFSEANTALQHILSHDTPILQRFFQEPQVQTFFKAYIALCNVCAFVLAGRKSRWRRDKLLSQSMRIGTAGSKIKGMKLTTVDKTELAREDQEAVEVSRSWKLQLGRLRRCVVEVKKHAMGVEVGVVPELSENMHVKILKEADGGVKSTQCCALCGLHRGERIAGVESSVHDSFGEFWIDQSSMHRWCRNFWDQHQGGLKGR